MDDSDKILIVDNQMELANQVGMDPAPKLFNGRVLVGPESTRVTCPFCLAVVKTRVKRTKTTRTYLVTASLCAIMCCFAWCAHCCLDATKNTDHYCVNCKAYLGTYER